MNDERKKNIIKLLNDEEFIQWLINPSPAEEEFWSKKTSSDSDQTVEDIDYLRSLMYKLEIKESALTQGDKEKIKEKILSATKNKRKNRLQSFNTKKYYWAAAVAVLFISTYFYFFKNLDNTSYNIDYQTILLDIPSEELPTDAISLTTANKGNILLDGDSVHVKYDEFGQASIVDATGEESTESQEPSMNKLTVPYGKISNLTLSDGTEVWINSGTTVIYPSIFLGDRREIYVEGEIFLNVVKKEKLPFHVKTSQLDVEVKGTSFNVTAYKGEENQSIVLVSGLVDVKRTNKKSVELKPNQMYLFDTSSNSSLVTNIDTDEYTAWINRYLLFKDKSLSYVLGKLSKHYNVDFIFDEAQMGDSFFNGKLDLKEDINKVLENISTVKNIDYVITNRIITIQLK